jgi:hypothetical protein
MVVPQDDHSSGSSTCLPNNHDEQHDYNEAEESQDYEVDYSTVPPTPNVCSFLASPVRMSTGRYNFRSIPERLHHSGRLSTGSGSGSSSGDVGSGGRGSGSCQGSGVSHSVAGNAGVTATSFAATSLVALSTTTTATTNSSANRPNPATAISSHGSSSASRHATGTNSSNPNPSTRPNATGTNSSNANPSTRPNATGTTSSNANQSATRPNGNRGRAQPTSARGRTGRNHPPVATVAVTCAGVRNYSSDELDRMLQCICTVLPTGNYMWELVAQLHANYFPDCNRNAVSIKKILPTYASKQPTTGNPTIPPSVALAKEIREDINAKAGVTDADVSDLFDDGVAVDEYDDDVLGEVADDNQQGQMVLESLPSAASSSLTGATSSIVGSRAKTRQNQVALAIEATSSSTNASFSAFLQQRQIEEFEWKQRRLEMEEARARHEEELHELQRKESRQQEHMNNLFQLAMTGIMAYMGMKKSGSNDDGK